MNNTIMSDPWAGTDRDIPLRPLHSPPRAIGTDRPSPDFRQAHDASTPTSNSNSNSIGSSPGEGYGLDSGAPSRKRSIGSSHLGIDPSNWEVAKSRRASPNLGLGGSSNPGFGGGFGDEDSQVIDLTG